MKKENGKQGIVKKNKRNMVPFLIIGTPLILVFIFLIMAQMKEEKSTNISGLPVGTPAPKFVLDSTKGEISLEKYKGKNIIIYFYEGNS